MIAGLESGRGDVRHLSAIHVPHARDTGRLVMQRQFRLHRSNDIQRVRRTGKSYAHPLLVLVVVRNPEGARRAAITTSRSVGGAVQRNLIRRRIRATMRDLFAHIPDGWDLLLIARPAASTVEYAQLAAAVRSLLCRAGVLRDRSSENDCGG